MSKMKLKLSKRKPILVSVLWALLILSFYILTGIITKKANMDEFKTKLVNSICIWGSVFIAIIYIWKSDYNFADILYTLIQIAYAFAFGFVFVEIFYLTKSLIPVILWHFLHDFLSFIENTPDMQVTIFFGGLQTVILIIYAVYMLKKIYFKNAPIPQ